MNKNNICNSFIPFALVNGHKYQEYQTANTWQFYLYNNRSRVLLQYSCHKSCYTKGKARFWAKVADLYNTIQAEKTAKARVAQITQDRRKESKAMKVAALEADLEALFSNIEQEQQEIHDYIRVQSNTDFLGKIKRVSMSL